ncbi:MAG: hypothetical protein FIB01_09060 [Gemmatimonadetes bacterium]|nr:hypothetical protein [Gemmatimonadota bacterium]
MIRKTALSIGLLAASVALIPASCARDADLLDPARFPSDGAVFKDAFAAQVGYAAFQDSKLDALSVDPTGGPDGSAALKISVPAPGDPTGGFAGGALVAGMARDLAGYDALTFWARASRSATLDMVGLGNDNTGGSRFGASRSGVQLSSTWRKYVVPIPLSDRLALERGLFQFADAGEGGVGYEVWFDDIQYERVGTIAFPRPVIPRQTLTEEVGRTVQIQGTSVVFDVGGSDQTVTASPAYFTFMSSDSNIARVGTDGRVSIVGAGTATITAKLGSATASGAITFSTTAPPTTAPPVPTRPASEVLSLFSDAYPNATVDTWSTSWDQADVADVQVAGNAVKRYSNFGYAAIEFSSQTANASATSHIHLDLWVRDAGNFRIKLVDFGANGAYGGGDDSESEVTLTPATSPALKAGAWTSIDLPLSAFPLLQSRSHLAQIIIAGSSPITYLDNVYFYLASPAAAAPTPSVPAAQVISLFSNAYPNVAVDTWSASWDNADVADVQLSGNATKRYTNLVFAGIEFTSHPVDASTMTRFHMDIWTPYPTAAPAALRVKLVDFGANGSFGGGDDVEHELAFTAASSPPLATGSWVGIDVPLSAFTGLTTRGHLAQLIISGDPRVVFVDNVYFYRTAPTAPTVAAPVPTVPAGNVISLFSNSYPNVAVDTWSAGWDAADLADVQIAGNDAKKYSNLMFAGIEFTSAPVNAAAMTHFHLDIWTPDPVDAPAAFRVKLVDFGADGAYGGGNDVEHELAFTATSSPALASGSWISLDIPLAAFTGLVTREHLAQLLFVADPSGPKTVYMDNVFFYRAGQLTAPLAPAPTPTLPAANVISLYSNAYANVPVDTWSAGWDAADVEDVQISGNAVKKYTNLVFAGIEFTSAPINAAAMPHFHLDIWTPDASAPPAAFRVKLVDFGANGGYGGGDDVEHELAFTATTTPALATGSWISLDIPLSAFTGLTTRAHLAQMLFVADGSGPKTVFVDNIYLHR